MCICLQGQKEGKMQSMTFSDPRKSIKKNIKKTVYVSGLFQNVIKQA